MKTWMKTAIAASLIAVTGAGTTAALARDGMCDGFGPHGKAGWHRMAPEDVQARMAQRADLELARLELALALKPEQQSAWNEFKQAMSERSAKMAGQMVLWRKDGAPQTAVERLQRMEELSKLRQAEMAETRKAVERFYGTLSDAQKKVFDADFGARGPRMRKGEPGAGKGRGECPRGERGRG